MNLYEEYLKAMKAATTIDVPVPEAVPEPELLEHDPDGCDECLAEEVAEEEREALAAETAMRLPPEPKPPEPKPAPTPNLPESTAEVVVDAKTLRAFVEQVAAVAGEAKVRLGPDGLRVTAVDPAHVQIVEATLPASNLDLYDVLVAGKRAVSPCDVGLDFEKLLGVLKKLKGKVTLTFRFGIGTARERLEVAQNGSSREMALLDTAGMTDPKIPTFPIPAKVAMDGKTFLEVLKGAGEVSDHIAIVVTPTALRFEAEGDVDRYKHEFQAGTDAVEYLTPVTQEYRSLFPLDYLTNAAKTVKGSRLVLWLGADLPIRMDWDGPETHGTFLCASRIESPD